MAKSNFEKKKEQLERLERRAREKIQQRSTSVESGVSTALKTGLIVGGTLFLSYQLTRLFTSSSSKTEPDKKKALTGP